MTQAYLPFPPQKLSVESPQKPALTTRFASISNSFGVGLRFFLERLQPSLLAMMLSLTTAFSGSVFAADLARWDFEDGDLVVDTASAANIAAVIVSTDPTPDFADGDGSASAASFNSLNVNQVSAIEAAIDTEGFDLVTLQFSARISNTASKYWRLQADAGAGFVDVGPLLEFTVSATFIDFDVALPVPSVGTSLAVRILASD
ncbi:MAG: hypothetical protein GY822_02165, partial [Deltaproteobacteria bacterium]|nr:hypothetical protein [Deltaproteobacteria bacterium]